MSLAPDALASMQSTVLDWYAGNRRDLAFRRTSDPWAVLVSEVIAQQTQAARAAEAWTRLIERYPTPAAMAATSVAEVIRDWRGLGYNSRATRLWKAAVAIVRDHGGVVPDSYEGLTELPGIGPYTARAVLAIAFGRPVAALDTNIRRVLGRAFMPEATTTASSRAYQAAADRLVPGGAAAMWTHALMDLGATICRKRAPRCEACPLRARCPFDASAATAAPRRRKPPPRFESTTRWLRGRIIDRLRDAPDRAWLTFAEPIGEHERPSVEAAVAALVSEGMLERSGARVRLASG